MISFENFVDVSALEVVFSLSEGHDIIEDFRVEVEVLWFNDIFLREDESFFEFIFELSDVSWPRISFHGLDSFRRESFHGHIEFIGVSFEERLRDENDVIFAIV